jgi:hypothetical protein
MEGQRRKAASADGYGSYHGGLAPGAQADRAVGLREIVVA